MTQVLDLLVAGELALDHLGEQSRLGGVAYAALAARQMGLTVGVAGPMGMEPVTDAGLLLQSLEHAGVNTSLVTQLPSEPLTRFVFRNFDEVEPQRLISGYPRSVSQFQLPDAGVTPRAVLLHPMHPVPMRQILERWPEAIFALDLQYNLENRAAIEACLSRAQIVFASFREAIAWCEVPTVSEAARQILAYGPRLVVVKFGQGGSAIYTEAKETIPVPAYQARYRYTVGAGDVYNAVFLRNWLADKSPLACGQLAAAAASMFTESFNPFEQDWGGLQELTTTRTGYYLHPDAAANIRVYLAGPFFNQAERDLLSRVKASLECHGFTVYSPFHETGIVAAEASLCDRQRFFRSDLHALGEARVVVAITDGNDTGTAWECGYAYAKGIPVVLLSTELRMPPNLMLAESCRAEVHDLRQLVDDLFERFSVS